MACLLVRAGTAPAELDSWAEKVVSTETHALQQKAHWKPSEEWGGRVRQFSPVFELLGSAFRTRVWCAEELDAIAKVMQHWAGDGAIDGIRAQHLRSYITTPPPGERSDARRAGSPRRRSSPSGEGTARVYSRKIRRIAEPRDL